MSFSRPNPDQAIYVISVAAELADMHPQTLRIYERKGLLDPARTNGGNRRYSDTDIAMLKRIAELTSAGLIDSANVETSIFGTGKFYQEQLEEKKENIYSNIDDMLSNTLKTEDE